MKEKTSITLSSDLLADIDRLAGRHESRSAVIERLLRHYFRRRERARRHAADLDRLNEAADRLNREAADVLEYQIRWPE